MTRSLREELERAADQAPDQVPDAADLWSQAQRANRRSLVVTAVLVVAAVLAGGFAVRAAVVHDPTPPADQPHQLGFPDDLYDVPSRTPTTDSAGPLGPLAFVSLAEHKGFWPWSAKTWQLYGVSAEDGEYRFLSLPDATLSPDLTRPEGNPLSPDGRHLVYTYGNDPELDGATGFAVYDAVSGEASKYPTGAADGSATGWVAWAPDGQRVAIGSSDCIPEYADDCSSQTFADLIVYDVRTDRFETIPGTAATLGGFDAFGWKPAGVDSPEGLAASNGKAVVVRDPGSGAVVGRYRWTGQHNFQSLMLWNRSGDTFVVRDAQCDNDCPVSAFVTVKGTVRPDGKVSIEPLARPRQLVSPIGWMGTTPTSDVLAATTLSSSTTELQIATSDGLVRRPVSSGSGTSDMWPAADVVATGELAPAPAPKWPWGWPMAVAVLVMCLYLIRFARGIAAMYQVKPPSAGPREVVAAVWRQDGVAMLSLIPALSVGAALVVREIGWIDPLYIALIVLLTTWTMDRSLAGYNLLTLAIILYTAVTALWRVDGWLDIALVCLIGLAQLCCLRAPGTQGVVGRGQEGSRPGGPPTFFNPGEITMWGSVSGAGGG